MKRQEGFYEIAVILILLAACFAGLVYVSYRDQVKWDEFARAHSCKKIGEQSGTVGVGFAPSANGGVGPVVVATGSKTGFSCDDGVTYWR